MFLCNEILEKVYEDMGKSRPLFDFDSALFRLDFVWASTKRLGPVDFNTLLTHGPVQNNANVAAFENLGLRLGTRQVPKKFLGSNIIRCFTFLY